MLLDNEILNTFLEDITSINYEILEVLKSLNENLNQPEKFLLFSNLVDRVYETAATLGFSHLSDYCLSLKHVSRKTGNAKIQRIYGQIMKLMLNYTGNYVLLKQSLENKLHEKEFTRMIFLDMKKMENLERDVFSYVSQKT